MAHREASVAAILVSFFIAFLLTALPLPEVLAAWRPLWVAMVLVFWVLNAPHRVGIWIGFGLGILLDGLQGNAFGLHPLGLALVAWLTRLSYRRVRVFSIWQTGGLLLAIMLAYQLTGYFVLRFLGEAPASALYWLPSLTSALVWPTVMLSLRSFIHRF